jgi:cellobiose phosphorylase
MINPINHGKTPADLATYKVEPYVMAADVYGVHPHTGRGGWTWYTGSAGWMYQLIISSFLGIRREGDKLWIEPATPSTWEKFEVKYRFGSTLFNVSVHQAPAAPATTVTVDGYHQDNGFITLVDDGRAHEVEIRFRPRTVQDVPALVDSSPGAP